MAADVLGINPVAGVVTTFKIRFQSPPLRALPTRAYVHIYFPPEFKVETDTIAAKRNIDCPFEVMNIEKAGADGRQCIILGAPRIVDPDPKSKKPPKPPDVRSACGCACVRGDTVMTACVDPQTSAAGSSFLNVECITPP
jgi:hypothetical protein